jgi:hypothetical protein
VTGTTAIDIASDTTKTIDIIAGETPEAQGLSTVSDAFVRGASAYKTASATGAMNVAATTAEANNRRVVMAPLSSGG